MSKRTIVVVVALIVVAVGLWLGGHAVWNVLVAMHHRGP
jgi:hypothetical protein